MKALGEAAVDLPWLSPCAGSLVALTRPHAASVWSEARFDPGCVLLLARAADATGDPTVTLSAAAAGGAVLETALRRLAERSAGFVDWALPGPSRLYRICLRQAHLAQSIAEQVGCDTERAWAGGLLAPLGWLAVCAVDSNHVAQALDQPAIDAAWQQQAWGLDHAAIALRLARLWRLPTWLTSLVGHLGLHVSVAERLGADPLLFQVVQLAVALCRHDDGGLGLNLGADLVDLQNDLKLAGDDAQAICQRKLSLPIRVWEEPAAQPYLVDMLRLALDQRTQSDAPWIERLQRDLDQLQRALEFQCASEKERLQTLKLSALAELAAGAGHEINNPLAVISGQAQYLQKQLVLAEETLAEETSPAALLEAIKAKFSRPLQTIIGQTQRIHYVLKELMQFARPGTPRPQPISVAGLVRDGLASLNDLAVHRNVRLVAIEPAAGLGVQGDAMQLKTILSGLVRNAVEATPAEGWAGLRVEQSGGIVRIIVEDSGPGPAPGALEHLFDPFFSGRSAGRGRGLGLPTAWRLARQQGGDVAYAGHHQGVTRFILSLPAIELPATPAHLNGVSPTAEGHGRHNMVSASADAA